MVSTGCSVCIRFQLWVKEFAQVIHDHAISVKCISSAWTTAMHNRQGIGTSGGTLFSCYVLESELLALQEIREGSFHCHLVFAKIPL